MDAIRTAELTKTDEQGKDWVSNLHLTIQEGGVCGLLGPEGSGKSTAIRLLGGLEQPTHGMCWIFGVSPWENRREAHRLCGIFTNTAKLYGYLTGMQNLLFFGAAYGMDRQQAERRAVDLLKELDIWDARDLRVNQYTPGMERRLSLARALIHTPRVLLLDEPAQGLDPVSSREIKDLVLRISADEQVTVLIATQDLDYAQKLCHSFLILENGIQKADGNFMDLCARFGKTESACIRLAEGSAVPKGFLRGEDGWFHRKIQGESEMPSLLRNLISQGISIYEAHMDRPVLKDIYDACMETEGMGKSETVEGGE